LAATYLSPGVARWFIFVHTKNPILGQFWRALEWKVLAYFMAIKNILRPFGIIYDHLAIYGNVVYFSPFLVYSAKKNLATLPLTGSVCKKMQIYFPEFMSPLPRA
jgi:hypothetical protein